MIIKEDNINEDDYKLQMIMNNDIKDLIPLSIKSINNKPEIRYEISSLISMESMYAKKPMSGKDIYNLVKSISNLANSMKEYLLDINSIIFEMEFIYLKRQEEKYQFCYYPGNSTDYQESLRAFFDKLLEHINYNDRKAVLIAYEIQQITISDSFTIQDLMECAKKNMKKGNPEHTVSEVVDYKDENKRIVEEPTEENLEKSKFSGKYLLKNIVSTLRGKNKYKDEEELLYEKESKKYSENIELLEENNTEIIFDEREDATMLLTSLESASNITLRRIDSEENMEITPNSYPCVLGKSKKSSDFYINSPVVSRVHMRISEDMAGYYVEDLNSTNGTYVNGVQLHPHEVKEINEGDQITLANVDFIVEQN